MSEYSLDEPRFKAPGAPPPAPPSSDSSVETPPDARRKCIACPRRMSKKTADRHTLCVNCRGFDCDINTRCEECLEWPEEEVKLYAKYRKSLKSKDSSSKSKSSAPPPPADSRPSPQQSPRDDFQSQIDSLNVTVNTLTESLSARLDAFMTSFMNQSAQLSSQPQLGPDAGVPQPGVTAGESRTFQALGVPSGTSVTPSSIGHPFGQGSRAPASEQLGSASAPHPLSAPVAATPSSAPQAPPPPPPRFEDPPPQPSTSGWVPPGPQPPRNRRDSRSSSESEASEAESDVSCRDSAAFRLADLIYEVCPDSRPLSDAARHPRCGFKSWFGQPEAPASRQSFRLYPRVAEVESEVAARSEALARRTKPLLHIIPPCSRPFAVEDDLLFASSQPVNPSFAQLAGARAVGSRRWGSITFSEMERLERLLRNQLEVTSSSLWLMSGILAMLKRDNFQPSDPTLFNSALSSVSASLSRQARSASVGSAFMSAKRRESLLAHTTLPVPEAQRRSLTVAPGSSNGLFHEELLAEVVSQVQCSSLISSNLAVSRSLSRGRSRPSSASPLADPLSSGPPRGGRPSSKRSASSSRSGGHKRFRGGKGSTPSSKPLGFRK